MSKSILFAQTKAGAKLKLSSEQEELCQVVYKKSEDTDGYMFAGLWNPEHDYSDNYAVVSLRSVFDAIEGYPDHQVFANIIGSSDDSCPYSSWLSLFRQVGIECSSCVTDGYFYDPNDTSGRTYFTDYRCNNSILVGGHVVPDFYNASPQRGTSVYLIPICQTHNVSCTDNSRNTGSGFYMLARKAGRAIRLKNYLQKLRE